VAPTVLILLVEDEALLRIDLKDALVEGGFEVAEAKDGATAMALLDEKAGNFCGLVTDIKLGKGPDGWQVAMHAREVNPSMPVVYTTGTDSDQWAAHGVPHSILVSKPYAPVQVITAISSLINIGGSSH
jgi:CheY-like chemotaxis protein